MPFGSRSQQLRFQVRMLSVLIEELYYRPGHGYIFADLHHRDHHYPARSQVGPAIFSATTSPAGWQGFYLHEGR